MPNDPKTMPSATVASAPTKRLDLEASARAPFVFFEDAPAFGARNGIVKITLTADHVMADTAGHVEPWRTVVAHLCMGAAAAAALRRALDGALLLIQTPETAAKN